MSNVEAWQLKAEHLEGWHDGHGGQHRMAGAAGSGGTAAPGMGGTAGMGGEAGIAGKQAREPQAQAEQPVRAEKQAQAVWAAWRPPPNASCEGRDSIHQQLAGGRSEYLHLQWR